MKYLRIFLEDYRIRFSSYISIWLIYLFFMFKSSLRGIDWLPFQEERVRSSVNHIINNAPFIKFGVTSWLPFDSSAEINKVYAVQAHEYLHYFALMKLGGEDIFSLIAPHIDKVIIFFLSSIVAEVCVKIFDKNNNLSKNIIGISSFLVFCTLPFTYRMLIGSWQDVYCLLFIYLSFLLFSFEKKKLGLLVLIYGLLWQYHWSVFLGLFYLSTYIYSKLSYSGNKLLVLFPPGFRSRNKPIIFMFAFSISPLINLFQRILLNLNGYNLTNSGLLFRIGIDNANNLHHGGLISAFQFLGGNRITLCIQPEILSNLNSSNISLAQIFTFNCILSILSFALFSLISIFSYSIFAKFQKELSWILIPPAFAFFFFVFIFQQNNATHLQGYSIYFAPIFTIGILSLFHQFQWLNKKHLFSHIFFVIFVSALVITNIRVSFLTGING